MAHSKYGYSKEIKEIEGDTFECTTDYDERSITFHRRGRRGHYYEDEFEYANASVQGIAPMDSMLNYFECEIVSNGDTGFGIWIGIGPWSDLEDPDPQIHVRKHGVYYEANTGRICISDVYRGQGSERGRFEIGSTCTTGDRIGCGIEFDGDRQSSDSIHVFFTKNGKQLGDSIRCMMPPFSMCPMVGMGEKGQRVHFVQHCYRPSLLRAVKKCDTDVLGTILQLECSEAPSHDLANSIVGVAFHEACLLGLADVVEIFFEHYANGDDLITMKSANGKGLNALQIATMNKRNHVVKILLRRNDSKRAHRETDEEGCTPLLVAAKNGDEETLSCLLEHVSELAVARNEQSTGSIQRSNDADPRQSITTETAAKYLQEVDVHSADISSENAVAIELQPLKMEGSLQAIQDRDSEIQIMLPPEESLGTQKKSQSVKQESLRGQHPDIFTEVRREQKNVMHLAAENGHEKIIKLLWSHSHSREAFIALMTRTDKGGNTPFHLCCKNGHAAVVRKFLAILEEDGVLEQANRCVRRETPMEVLESLGTESPLLWSFQRESPMEEKYFDLLNKGDDSSEYSQYFPAGYSPMHLACRHGHVEVFNLLHHSKCSNVHITNRYQETLLHVAAAGGHVPIIEMLIHAQARATAKDANDQTPLHCAARNGRVEAVRCLMEAAYDQRVVDSAEKNEMKNSGSCRARATRKRRKVVYIEGIGDIGYDSDEEEDEDLGGVTYLDEAIRKGHREVVDVIISYGKLDDITYSGRTLSLLIKQMPDAAKSVLDVCIKPVNWDTEQYKESCEVDFDYDLLKVRLGKIPKRNFFSAYEKLLRRKKSPIKTTYGWKSFLWSLTKSEEEDLVRHPIVEGFVHNIWKQKYRWIYYSSLLLHVIFVAMLTCLALLINNPTSTTCQSILSGQFSIPTIEAEVNISQIPDSSRDVVVEYFSNQNITVTDNLTNVSSNSLCASTAAQIRDILTTFTSVEISCAPECGVRNGILVFIRALVVMLILISAIKIVSELGQLLHGCCEPAKNRQQKYWWLYFYYLADIANWLELPLYIFTIMFASAQLNSECTCIQTWEWNIGIAALFLAWASVILFLRKLDLFDTGIYVLMFEILIRRFLKTIILTSLLVVMFALTFFLTFNQVDPSFARSPFSSAFNSLWKMTTMITGEMDYESIFRQSSSATLDPDPPLPFPEISHVLWIVFLVMIPILLGNLLTGLAVDDVKVILSTAEVRKLKSKMDLIVSMNQLTIIWVTLLLYALLPVLMIVGVLLTCVCTCLLCPCCIGYIVYEVLNGGDCNIFDAMAGWYFSFFEYLFEEGEPQISTKTVHPFKLRSPLSTSKYKSPESLAKIIEKTSPEEKVPDLLKVMQSSLVKKMESCIKDEVESCLREKVQNSILEEMKAHFKQMEDNVVKRVEQMMVMSREEKPEFSDSGSPISGGN